MREAPGLVGVWRLVAMETAFADGTRSRPYGPNCDGRLFYEPNGRMAAHLWDPDRHAPGHPPASGPDPAYFSYTGTWTCDAGRVHHTVDAATDPDWSGRTIFRDIRHEESQLVLSAEVIFDGKPGVATMRWERP